MSTTGRAAPPRFARDGCRRLNHRLPRRGVRVWLKEHDSKSCDPNGSVGSNPTLSATSFRANPRFTYKVATMAGLPGNLGDPSRLHLSLRSVSRPASAASSGFSPRPIWPVPEASVARRKCSAGRPRRERRSRQQSRISRSHPVVGVLSGSRTQSRTGSRDRIAQRAAIPNSILCSDQSSGIGSRRDSTVSRFG